MKCFERSYRKSEVNMGMGSLLDSDADSRSACDEKALLEDQLRISKERSMVLLQMIMWEQQHSFWRYW